MKTWVNETESEKITKWKNVKKNRTISEQTKVEIGDEENIRRWKIRQINKTRNANKINESK